MNVNTLAWMYSHYSGRFRGAEGSPTPFLAQISNRPVLCSMSKMKLGPEFIAIIYNFKVYLSILLDITDVDLCTILIKFI